MVVKARFMCACDGARTRRQLRRKRGGSLRSQQLCDGERPKKPKNRSNSRAKKRCRCVNLNGIPIMSESLATAANAIASHTGASDSRMLAQVEKWMVMIREINREQPGVVKMPAVG